MFFIDKIYFPLIEIYIYIYIYRFILKLQSKQNYNKCLKMKIYGIIDKTLF